MGQNPNLSVGQLAPTFDLPSDQGQNITSEQLSGAPYIIYFYPKDMTSGCTTQACDFRDNLARLTTLGYQVIGVSPDPVTSHHKFRDKHQLNFPLLADTEQSLAQAYGVWREKTNYGKTYMGIVRSTFVVDAQGTITHIYDNVRAKGHVDKLLKDLSPAD